MKAQVIHAFGNADVFVTEEIAKPKVIPGHILIRVAATSVNPVDTKIRQGAVPAAAPELPAVLHGDVAGIVEEVGPGVSAFKPGDEVYACAGGVKGSGGALADYLLADAALVAHKPQKLSLAEAAVLPLVSITAWEALVDRAKLKAGQKVLIHAGTGGVGHIAIQLAKSVGATVYTTVSNEEKAKLARQLGADYVINYRQQSVAEYVDAYTEGKGFEVVMDTVGKENLDRSIQAAAIGGTVVTISARSTHDLTPLHSKGLTLHAVFMLIPLLHNKNREHHGYILSEIAKLVDAGKLTPLIDQHVFSFEDVAEAHRHLEAGKAIGKISVINNRFE